ncbi:FAD-linked sulfhydryl oxidase ERV1 [Nymphaea colorata]|nr:FAD-linked sulfhydryl oxidase ERV1 [Nymphaea colorata]
MAQQSPLDLVLRTCDSMSQCLQSKVSHIVDGIQHIQKKHVHNANEAQVGGAKAVGLPPFLSSFFSSATAAFGPSPAKKSGGDAVTAVLRSSTADVRWEKDGAKNAYPKAPRPLTKEELGRCTWTLLHAIGAQYPDHPTKQQKRDVKELMAILSRLHPCKDCADHFKEVLKANPVQAGSQAELSLWLCHVHNVVNRSIGKPVFPCNRLEARWGKLECEDRLCDVQVLTPNLK